MNRKPRREPDPYDGLLLVDKPAGWTSNDVVVKVRNHFRFNKVGHGGTLDPMATGLLVLLVGKGTRLSNLVMGGDKGYEGAIRLGTTTTTQDREGEILEQKDASRITRPEVEAAVRRFTGDIEQIPPMVSALKKDGVPLYKLARQGREIEREPRKVSVFEFEVTGFECPLVHVRVKCGKGTYVRTLAHDLGQALGVGACLENLRRTQSGPLSLEMAHALEEILRHDRQTIGAEILHVADMAR